MSRLLHLLFTRHDAAKDDLVLQSAAQTNAVVSAANRLNDTIGALLEHNDTLTLRRPNNVPQAKDK